MKSHTLSPCLSLQRAGTSSQQTRFQGASLGAPALQRAGTLAVLACAVFALFGCGGSEDTTNSDALADEPVSALDMTVQKQILKLFRTLQTRYGFACLFVSHDLGAVEQVADRVAVMENGRIVETGTRDDVFDSPQHAYTRRLLDAAMLLDRSFAGAVDQSRVASGA